MEGVNGHSKRANLLGHGTPISALAGYLKSALSQTGEIIIPGAILSQVASEFLSADQSSQEPISRPLVEEAIEALCSGDGAIGGRLNTQSFSAIVRLLLRAGPSLTKERGLCILVESLARGRSRSGTSPATFAKLRKRKTAIGSQVLHHLLRYFTEATEPTQFRRWVGFLLCELLKDSEENKEALEVAAADHQSLGSIALENKNPNLKLISGLIISHQVMFGSNRELYWPSATNKETLKEFPEVVSEESQWLTSFHSFMEKLEPLDTQKSNVPPEPFALALMIDGEAISHKGGISVALEGILTMLIPPSKGEPPQFVDIPFQNILSVETRPYQYINVPTELLPDPTDVVLHLCAHRENTHHHNAVAKSAEIVIISFAGLLDAAEVAQYLTERKMKVSEGKRSNDPTLAFIGVAVGDRKPEKSGERWIGFNTGPFCDLELHPSENTLEKSPGGDSELEKHEVQETISNEVGSGVHGTNDSTGEKQFPDGVVVPTLHVGDAPVVDPTDILEQERHEMSPEDYPSVYVKTGTKGPPNLLLNGNDTPSPTVPQPRRKLIHSMLRMNERSAGRSGAGSSSDTRGCEPERNPVVGEHDNSVLDLSQDGEPPKPNQGSVKPRKDAMVVKPLTTKGPGPRSKWSHPKSKRVKDMLAIRKERGVSSSSQTDWDEGFGGAREDGVVQLPAKPAKANKSIKLKQRKKSQIPPREADSSVPKPGSKPTKTATTGKRKPAPIVLQPLRSSRAAAVEATRRILNMDEGSENGSTANTQPGGGGEVSQTRNDPVTQTQLPAAKSVEPVTSIGSGVGIRSDTDQSGHILSAHKLTTMASETPARVADVGNRLQAQRTMGVKNSRNNMGQPTVKGRVEPFSSMAGIQERAPSSPGRRIADAVPKLTSGLIDVNAPLIPSAIAISGETGGTGCALTGFEDIEIESKPNASRPDEPVTRINQARCSTVASKPHSALAAIDDPLGDTPVVNVGVSPLDIQKDAKEIPPESPLGKRQRDTDLGESRTPLASKKPKAGISSKIPKAGANTGAPSIEDTICVRSPVTSKANPPSKVPPRVPITVLSLSSDNSDDSSYYSHGSPVSGPTVPTNIQAPSEIQGVGLAHPGNTTSVQNVAVRSKDKIEYAPHTQINITPRPRNGHDPILVDDWLSTKPKIVSWSGAGPRNQGRVMQTGTSTARKGLSEQAHPPKHKPMQWTSPTVRELEVGKSKQRTSRVQGDQLHQPPNLWRQNQPMLDCRKERRDKQTQNAPNALSSSVKQQISTLFVPRTNEDVVLNRDESRSPSIVEFPQKRSSQRARVEEGGSPIPITKYYSQENEQDKGLRDAVARNASVRTVNDLEEELSPDGESADEGQIAALAADDTHLTTSCETVLSSNRKCGPRSPWATSEIEFVGQETVDIIRTTRAPIDPFTAQPPKKTNSFIEKLQAKGVGEQVRAKRKRDGPTETTVKRIKKPIAQKGEETEEIGKTKKANPKQDPNMTLVNSDAELEPKSPKRDSTLYSTSTSLPSSPGGHQWSHEKDLRTQWRESLKPHQSDILDILYHISDDLVRHLVGKEICIEDIVHDYRRGGAKLIQELAKAYQEDYDAHQAALGKMRLALRDLLTKARRRINKGVKHLKEDDVAAARKNWNDRQKALLGQLREVTHLVNA
ncbi:MAG: hypothetical protein M1839_004956 [Geoglossum umbratile]|nr:MAG: hypothetical protein M1839_004956 [Geoglossum umbratile]